MINKALDLDCPDPAETYSTSPHFLRTGHPGRGRRHDRRGAQSIGRPADRSDESQISTDKVRPAGLQPVALTHPWRRGLQRERRKAFAAQRFRTTVGVRGRQQGGPAAVAAARPRKAAGVGAAPTDAMIRPNAAPEVTSSPRRR